MRGKARLGVRNVTGKVELSLTSWEHQYVTDVKVLVNILVLIVKEQDRFKDNRKISTLLNLAQRSTQYCEIY